MQCYQKVIFDIRMKKKISLIFLSLVGVFTLRAQTVSVLAIKGLLSKQGLSEVDINELVITNQYTSKHNGVTHVYFRQRYNGIDVFNGVGSVHFKQGFANGLNQSFVSNIASKAASLQTQISATQAVSNTAQYLNLKAPASLAKNNIQMIGFKAVLQDVSVSTEPIKLQLFYLNDNGVLRLVYNTNWLDNKTGNWWNVRVDASTGEIVDQNNWSISCHHQVAKSTPTTSTLTQNTKSNSVAKKSSNGTYNALPLGVESPLHGNRELLVNPSNSIASPYGWHDTDGLEGAEYTITRGNNVYASDDIDADDLPGQSPDGGSSLVFDYDYKVDTNSSSFNLNAATTNLFVWNNFLHDVMYHYGFDELGGNFQSNNYGKGGEGDDFVFADAQDGSGTNNANFATPPDGQNPRMQMFLWNNPQISFFVKATSSKQTDSTTFTGASFGPKTFSFTNVHLKLAVAQSGTSTLGCATLNDLTGKVVLIDRGTCNYATKARNAQLAGAVAVIIANTSNTIFTMGGSGSDITIPLIMISKSYGDLLKNRMLTDSVVVSFSSESSEPVYDSDMDNGVIAHEYGHGISNRLTGGPANTNCFTNQEQAGEGWSDFFCLYMTHGKNSTAETGRGIGTWLNYEATTGLGIRTFKYSRDMQVNPFTYNSIKTAAIPHGVGSVWCTMLNDLYWNLIDKYGYDSNLYTGTGGNNRCLQLVMDGLKLQPCSPGFVDARDAIILANQLNNNGEDTALIWSTFARRGLGYSAKQGQSTSRSDGTEAFDLPPVNTTGLNELSKESGMAVWPNPNNGSFELLLPAGATNATVELHDLTGRKVFTKHLVGAERLNVQTDNLLPGIYVLKANSAGKVFSTKVVITH